MRKFIWGALIGAGAALLFAPETGRTLRSRLRDKATKLANDAEDMMESKSRHVQNKMKGYRAKARRMAEHMADTMRDGTDGVTGGMEEPAFTGVGGPSI